MEITHARSVLEVFDEISYNKGSAIIKMLQHYLGDGTFQVLQIIIPWLCRPYCTRYDFCVSFAEIIEFIYTKILMEKCKDRGSMECIDGGIWCQSWWNDDILDKAKRVPSHLREVERSPFRIQTGLLTTNSYCSIVFTIATCYRKKLHNLKRIAKLSNSW